MMAALILCSAIIIFLTSYRYIGRHLDALYGLSKMETTPAQRHLKNRDYSQSQKTVVFSHHFASIAGAAPIIGPIVACASFGWLPTVLWIILGTILLGGVHDFSALAISLHSDGKSIGYVAQKLLGKPVGKLFAVFILLAMAYVLVVFLDLTATSFLPPEATPNAPLNNSEITGGIVAAASVCLVIFAMIFGKLEGTWFRKNAIYNAMTGIGLLTISIVLAHYFPITRQHLPFLSHRNWIIILTGYALIASILPVNILLQPRDFISSFLLYFCMIVGIVGIVTSIFTKSLPLAQPGLLTLHHPQLGSIFPALFITVSCGACSGFHSIVSSGSTAKQISNATDARFIAYGGMLTEGLLALIAAISFMIIPISSPMKTMSPPDIFSHGLGLIAATIGIPASIGHLLGFLAISTFLLTTLDTATRLARYILAEILPSSLPASFKKSYVLSILCLSPVLLLSTRTYLDERGHIVPLWKSLWSLFGATNQLLGALALCIAVLWVKRYRPMTSRLSTMLLSLGTLFLCATTFLGLYNAVLEQQGSIRYIGICILLVAIIVSLSTIKEVYRLATFPRKETR